MTAKRSQPPTDETDFTPSKSQLKREARELFDLGRSLAELPEGTLRELPLEDHVLQAVLFARSIRSNVARKRQLGFLARLLRSTDMTPVTRALESRRAAARSLNARHHRAEAWRDLLLGGGNEALERLIESRDDVDVQAVRALVRNAQSEEQRGKPPAAARKLFRMLRELDERSALPAEANRGN